MKATVMGARSRSPLVDVVTPAQAPGLARAPLEARQLDLATQELVGALRSRLRSLYGSRLQGLILFGSRAQRDFAEESDADVAIVLKGPIERPYDIKCDVIDATYDLFLDSGIIIQPWPFQEDWLEAPQASPYPQVVRAAQREGIRL